MRYAEALEELQSIRKDEMIKVSLAFVSNLQLDQYLSPFLTKLLKDDKVYPEFHNIPYEECFLSKNDEVFQNADIVIAWINFESLYPNIINDIISGKADREKTEEKITEQLTTLYYSIQMKTNARILWMGLENFYLNLNLFLGDTVNRFDLIPRINESILGCLSKDSCMLDLNRMIAETGLKNSFSLKNKYRWNCPYSEELLFSAAQQIKKQYYIGKHKCKKCLVLDCDNVLWNGILSESGVEGVKLGGSGVGRFHQDFQRFLLSLYYHGIILTVCSKNDLPDVIEIFDNHNGMLLKREHISCFQVNWNNKVENIQAIAETLNIGTDSMIFIDDSVFEIESVKSILPEVTTVLFERDTVFEQLQCLNLMQNPDLGSIQKRNDTYKTNVKRMDLKKSFHFYDDYLSALETKIDIKKAEPVEYARIIDLTQRANKCTNGRRYILSEIKQKLEKEEYHLYSVNVSDKFGDLGLVGVIGVYQNQLDLFCLSCRALGRNVEEEMCRFVTEKHIVHDVYFQSTHKNDELGKLLSDFIKKSTD